MLHILEEPVPTTLRPGLVYRWQEYVFPLVFLLVCIGFMVLPVRKAMNPAKINDNKDYSVWYAAGDAVWHGEPLYVPDAQGEYPFMYPPFGAIFFHAPASRLPFSEYVTLLGVLNTLAWAASCLLAVYLARNRAWGDVWILYVFPWVISLAYVWDTFFLGQVNVVLLALMLAAFASLRQQLPILAGALIALAAAIKAFPVLALGYLLYRRHWKAAGSMAAVLVTVLILLPAPIRGFGRNWDELRQWSAIMIAGSEKGMPQRTEIAYTFKNQSLQALVHRLVRDTPAGHYSDHFFQRSDTLAHEPHFHINVARLTPEQAQGVYWALAGALCLYFVYTMPAVRCRTWRTDSYEWPMALCLVVLLSPLAWSYFFCWLLPGFTRALAFILERPGPLRRFAIAWLATTLLVLALSLLQNFYPVVPALGTTTLGAISLFIGLGWMMRIELRSKKPVIAELD